METASFEAVKASGAGTEADEAQRAAMETASFEAVKGRSTPKALST